MMCENMALWQPCCLGCLGCKLRGSPCQHTWLHACKLSPPSTMPPTIMRGRATLAVPCPWCHEP